MKKQELEKEFRELEAYADNLRKSNEQLQRSLDETKEQLRIANAKEKDWRGISSQANVRSVQWKKMATDLSQIPTCAEFARLKQELESLRAKLPKWHRCDDPDEDGFVDLPPESGSYFAQYETTWADGVTRRYCEPLEYDADACDWPQLTNHCRVIRWCENPIPPNG